jgi:hypothetical protein
MMMTNASGCGKIGDLWYAKRDYQNGLSFVKIASSVLLILIFRS